MIKKLPIIFWVLFLAAEAQAQDPRFMQFFNDPLYTNPALTGTFDGRYRFVGHYRNQWASVSRAFVTGGAALDASNIFNIKKLGAGIAVFNDVAGDGDFQRLSALISLSYSLKLSADSTHNLILGAQGGINNYSINFNNFYFDDQYFGGMFNPNAPTAETFNVENSSSPLVNSGVAYRFKPGHRTSITAGVAVHNLLQPSYGIMPNETFEDRRYSIHAMGQFPVHPGVDLQPGIRYMMQGPHRELLAGVNAKILLDTKPYRYRALYFGPWLRARDAAVFYAGFGYDNWRFGISYGYNTSSLQVASNNRGAWEVSARYLIRHIMPKRINFKNCPEFL